MSNIRTILNVSLVALTAITGFNGLGSATIAAPRAKAVAPTSQRVRVFFPKNPGQQSNLGHVEPVWRPSPTTGVAQFAIAQLLAGPTAQERQQGFIAPIKLRGPFG